MMAGIKTTNKGKIITLKEIEAPVIKRMNEIMQEALKNNKDAAINSYLTQRKTRKTPSLIIGSFQYEIKKISRLAIRGIVFAGGPKAPYLRYVDEGHKLRGGKGEFRGYYFMDDGFKVGVKTISESNF